MNQFLKSKPSLLLGLALAGQASSLYCAEAPAQDAAGEEAPEAGVEEQVAPESSSSSRIYLLAGGGVGLTLATAGTIWYFVRSRGQKPETSTEQATAATEQPKNAEANKPAAASTPPATAVAEKPAAKAPAAFSEVVSSDIRQLVDLSKPGVVAGKVVAVAVTALVAVALAYVLYDVLVLAGSKTKLFYILPAYEGEYKLFGLFNIGKVGVEIPTGDLDSKAVATPGQGESVSAEKWGWSSEARDLAKAEGLLGKIWLKASGYWFVGRDVPQVGEEGAKQYMAAIYNKLQGVDVNALQTAIGVTTTLKTHEDAYAQALANLGKCKVNASDDTKCDASPAATAAEPILLPETGKKVDVKAAGIVGNYAKAALEEAVKTAKNDYISNLSSVLKLYSTAAALKK